MLAALEVVMWIAATVEAPAFDVSTSAWTDAGSLGSALTDYVVVFAAVTSTVFSHRDVTT